MTLLQLFGTLALYLQPVERAWQVALFATMLVAYVLFDIWERNGVAKLPPSLCGVGLACVMHLALADGVVVSPEIGQALLATGMAAFVAAAFASLASSVRVSRGPAHPQRPDRPGPAVLCVSLASLCCAAVAIALALGCGATLLDGDVWPWLRRLGARVDPAALAAVAIVPMLRLANVLVWGVLPQLSWEAGEARHSAPRQGAGGAHQSALERVLDELAGLPRCFCIGPLAVPCWPPWVGGVPAVAACVIVFEEATLRVARRVSMASSVPGGGSERPTGESGTPSRASSRDRQRSSQDRSSPFSASYVGNVTTSASATTAAVRKTRESPSRVLSVDFSGGKTKPAPGSAASMPMPPKQAVDGYALPLSNSMPVRSSSTHDVDDPSASRTSQPDASAPPRPRSAYRRSFLGLKEPTSGLVGSPFTASGRISIGERSSPQRPPPDGTAREELRRRKSASLWGAKPADGDGAGAEEELRISPTLATLPNRMSFKAGRVPTIGEGSEPLTERTSLSAPATALPSDAGAPRRAAAEHTYTMDEFLRAATTAQRPSEATDTAPTVPSQETTTTAAAPPSPPPPPPPPPPPGPWVHPDVLASLMRFRKSASGLAHDMKNPLTCVLSLAGILSADESLPAAARNHLKVMLVCCTHLLVMISNMRDNLWLLTGTLDVNPGTVAVLPIINQTISNIASIVRPAVKVIVDSNDAHECVFDEERLKRIIHVLLANAVKYTARGSIAISTALVDGMLELRFKDTGSGVDAATCKAFEAPAAAAHPRNDPHSKMALGLRYVARMLAVFRSDMTVVNNGKARNSGCTITVRLSTAKAEQQWAPTVVLPGGLDSLADAECEAISAALEGAPVAPVDAPPPAERVRSFSLQPHAAPPGEGSAVLSPAAPLGVPPAAAAGAAPPAEDAAASARSPFAPLASAEPSPERAPDAAPLPSPSPPPLALDTPAQERRSVLLELSKKAPAEPALPPELVEKLDVVMNRSRTLALGPSSDADRRDAVVGALATGGDDASRGEESSGTVGPSIAQPLQGFNYRAFTVMVVDDDPSNLAMLQMLLEGQGYQTVTASSGFDALEIFAESMPKPSCVLLDVTLPDISGHEVCEKLGQMTPGLPVPVIMISGKNEKQDIIRGLGKGALDYITKPFQAEEVLARVETILRFHSADVQQVRSSAKQVMEMIRLVFPKHVCDLVQSGQRVVAESMELVVVMVIEVVDFTRLCGAVPTPSVVESVNRLFCAYDKLMLQNNVERLDVFGHSYIAFRPVDASKGPEDSYPQQVQQMITVARAAVKITQDIHVGGFLPLQVRIGVHVGSAVGAVLCTRRPKYTMFGTAIKAATALQQAAFPSSITCSAEVATQLRAFDQPDGSVVQYPPVEVPEVGIVTPFSIRVFDGDGAPLRVSSSALSERGDRRVLRSALMPHRGPVAGASTTFPSREAMFDVFNQMAAQSGGAVYNALVPHSSMHSEAPSAGNLFGNHSPPSPSPLRPDQNRTSFKGMAPLLRRQSMGRPIPAQAPLPLRVPQPPPPPPVQLVLDSTPSVDLSDLRFRSPSGTLSGQNSEALEPASKPPSPPTGRARGGAPSPGPRRAHHANAVDAPASKPPSPPPLDPSAAAADLERVLAPIGLQHYTPILASKGLSVAALRRLDGAELRRAGVVSAAACSRLLNALHRSQAEPPSRGVHAG